VQADVPEAQVAGLVDVAHLFQRRQQSMRGRRRQAHAVGEIRQRDSRLGLGERFENVQAARQALDLPVTWPVLRAARTRGSGVVGRFAIAYPGLPDSGFKRAVTA
jgi:hypothetical protein